MANKRVAMLLGVLTGLLTLVGMLRLISGAFSGGMSIFAWGFALVALVPWIIYLGWRARRGRISWRSTRAVLILDGVGLVLVWLSTIGPVLALACALAAFVIIWMADLPSRGPRGEDVFVRIEDLRADERD